APPQERGRGWSARSGHEPAAAADVRRKPGAGQRDALAGPGLGAGGAPARQPVRRAAGLPAHHDQPDAAPGRGALLDLGPARPDAAAQPGDRGRPLTPGSPTPASLRESSADLRQAEDIGWTSKPVRI